jgi:hypothetical protein
MEVAGSPTPHPAFGHLLPVEGRRNATNIDCFTKARSRVQLVRS